MKYSACVSALFGGKPVEETLDAVKAAGLNQYEFWSWWDQDTERILEAQQRTGLRLSALGGFRWWNPLIGTNIWMDWLKRQRFAESCSVLR